MGFEPSGEHLIAGEWVGGAPHFTSSPATGAPHRYSIGSPDHVVRAAEAAEAAFASYGSSPRATRAAFLRAIADEIEACGNTITDIGCAETGLPEARLEGERGRTVGQLRLFADHLLKGEHLDRRHDPAQPDRMPQPRPDLRLMQRPVGPVAVFGASNFPLAFSVAGGDTASALAAGCPVIFKGHSAHPGTCEVVARAIHAARDRLGLPAGVFSLIQGGRREVGQALVQHPLVRAVGFTGSLAGGRALFDLCTQRPEPIPFFGELGSVNPMFILPGALAARGAEIAQGWAASLTMGAGQFCTNPGIAVVVAGTDAEMFVSATKAALAETPTQTMLTDGIAATFRQGRDAMADKPPVTPILSANCTGRSAAPALFRTSGAAWRADHALGEEVFGPLGLIVTVADTDEMLALAGDLRGQLTCCLHLDDQDTATARRLMPVLERKAGRILANGYPTGVEVCDAMVHGGPYPASTNFGATSVGTMAIRRFLRPVCYQNVPEVLLPDDLT